MKKIILYSILALAIAACKKSSDIPHPDDNDSLQIQQMNEEIADIFESAIKKIPQNVKGDKLNNNPEMVGYWLLKSSGGGVTGEYTDHYPHTLLLIDSFGRLVEITRGIPVNFKVIELNDSNIFIGEDKSIHYHAKFTYMDTQGTVFNINQNNISLHSYPGYKHMIIGSNWSYSYEKLAIDGFEYLLSLD